MWRNYEDNEVVFFGSKGTRELTPLKEVDISIMLDNNSPETGMMQTILPLSGQIYNGTGVKISGTQNLKSGMAPYQVVKVDLAQESQTTAYFDANSDIARNYSYCVPLSKIESVLEDTAIVFCFNDSSATQFKYGVLPPIDSREATIATATIGNSQNIYCFNYAGHDYSHSANVMVKQYFGIIKFNFLDTNNNIVYSIGMPQTTDDINIDNNIIVSADTLLDLQITQVQIITTNIPEINSTRKLFNNGSKLTLYPYKVKIPADTFLDNQKGVATSLSQLLSVIKGEIWYKKSYGLPLYDKISTKIEMDAAVLQIVKSHPEVNSITEFNSKIENGHKYSCSMKINSIFGEMQLNI